MSAGRLDVPWLNDPGLQRLLALLGAHGEEARIVGGAIRNTLLGQPVTDIDIATTSEPAETMRRLEAAGVKAVDTGMVRWQAFRRVIEQPYAFFQDDFAGRIATKIAQAGESVGDFIITSLQSLWSFLTFIALTFIVLSTLDWRMAATAPEWALPVAASSSATLHT